MPKSLIFRCRVNFKRKRSISGKSFFRFRLTIFYEPTAIRNLEKSFEKRGEVGCCVIFVRSTKITLQSIILLIFRIVVRWARSNDPLWRDFMISRDASFHNHRWGKENCQRYLTSYLYEFRHHLKGKTSANFLRYSRFSPPSPDNHSKIGKAFWEKKEKIYCCVVFALSAKTTQQ